MNTLQYLDAKIKALTAELGAISYQIEALQDKSKEIKAQINSINQMVPEVRKIYELQKQSEANKAE